MQFAAGGKGKRHPRLAKRYLVVAARAVGLPDAKSKPPTSQGAATRVKSMAGQLGTTPRVSARAGHDS